MRTAAACFAACSAALRASAALGLEATAGATAFGAAADAPPPCFCAAACARICAKYAILLLAVAPAYDRWHGGGRDNTSELWGVCWAQRRTAGNRWLAIAHKGVTPTSARGIHADGSVSNRDVMVVWAHPQHVLATATILTPLSTVLMHQAIDGLSTSLARKPSK